MTAQQTIFTQMRAQLENAGITISDNRIEGGIPVCYLADTFTDGFGAKAQDAGYVTLTIQMWERPTNRGDLSARMLLAWDIARRLEVEGYGLIFLKDESTQQITNDNDLMQGILSLRWFYSRR